MKQFKIILFALLLSVNAAAQQITIGVGSSANDGTGDPLRTAMQSTNSNFTELYTQAVRSATASGTNTYVATPDPPASLTNNQSVTITFTNANTGTSTLNLNSLGAKTLKKWSSGSLSNLASGDIPAGSIWTVTYDATNTCYQISISTSGGGSGDALTSNPLSQFAATTSLQLKGVISDETGSGAAVFATSPTFVTPALGTPASGVATNLTGTASGLTAGSVTTIPTLSGDVTNSSNVITVTKLNGVSASVYSLDVATPSTSGSTITLDCNSQLQRVFIGSATFATGKTMAVSNITNTVVFDFNFEITNLAATITMPSGWLMADANFSSHVWTPPVTGKYEMSGTTIDSGTTWKIKISGPYQ